MSETPTPQETGGQAKKRFKAVTEEDIRRQTDGASFKNGESYFRGNYILNPVLRGKTLRARSLGQSGGPYTVQVDFMLANDKGREKGSEKGNNVVEDWICDCPRGGFCKHIVALLLTWVRTPDEVDVRADVLTLLKEHSREELLDMIKVILKRYPDLDELIEKLLIVPAKTPTPGAAARVTINPTKIKRQAASSFTNRSYEWGEESGIAQELEDLVEIAGRYAEAGQWANAMTVFGAVVEEIMTHYEEMEDESGELAEVISDCADGLRECLQVQETLEASDRLADDQRLALFRALYTVWEHDCNYDVWDGAGDAGESVPEMLARAATRAERAQIEEWLRADLEEYATKSPYYSHMKRNLVDFLMTLKAQSGASDEEILGEYRNAGLYSDAAALLIDRGRIEEALEEYRSAGLFKEMADLLLAEGRVDEAIRIAWQHLIDPASSISFAEKLLTSLRPTSKERQGQALKFIEDRLWEEKDPRANAQYLKWLEGHYRLFGMSEKALETAQTRFRAQPDEHTYASVKEAAHMPGQPEGTWAELRPRLLATLEAAGNWRASIEVALSEKEVAAALSALDKLSAAQPRPSGTGYGGGYGWGYNYGSWRVDLELRVAAASEKEYPDKALSIYQSVADSYIEASGRENYQQAVKHLVRVKKLYDGQGQQEAWQQYIADLRARNKSLRALKEELDRHGLS